MTTNAYIDAQGFHRPTFSEILAELQATFRSIYGDDIYIENDSQDGQFIGLMADAIDKANQAAEFAYQSVRPSFASGVALDSLVKLKNISRKVASKSTVDVTITGTSGTIINNGIVADTTNNKWDLPTTVTIPVSSSIIVTATSQQFGYISVVPGAVNKIVTPVFGWASVSNTNASLPGSPVETDAELRDRFENTLPGLSTLENLSGSLLAIPGVTEVKIFENDTGTPTFGISAHSIACVVENGDSTTIAKTILDRKTPGCGLDGTTTVVVPNINGSPTSVKFFRPTAIGVDFTVTINTLTGYTTVIGEALKQAIIDFMAVEMSIGETLYTSRLYGPVNAVSETFNVVSIQGQKLPGPNPLETVLTAGLEGKFIYNATTITIV